MLIVTHEFVMQGYPKQILYLPVIHKQIWNKFDGGVLDFVELGRRFHETLRSFELYVGVCVFV